MVISEPTQFRPYALGLTQLLYFMDLVTLLLTQNKHLVLQTTTEKYHMMSLFHCPYSLAQENSRWAI